jgi:hypothetical protein
MGVQETKQATANLFRLMQNLQTRLGAARAYTDKDLTAQGLENARQSMADRSRATAAAKAQKLLGIAKDGAAFAQSRLQEVRPVFDPDNVAQLTRSAQAWQMLVQPMRDEGKSWFDIAKVADMDMMLAIQRFAPQRIGLDDPNDASVILGNLEVAIDRRLAEIHPDPEAKQLFEDARAAADHMVLAQHLADATDSRSPSQVSGALAVAKSYAYGHGIDLPKTPAPSLGDLETMTHLPQYAPTSVD